MNPKFCPPLVFLPQPSLVFRAHKFLPSPSPARRTPLLTMSGSSPSSGTSGSASKSAAPASKGSAGKGRDESGVITLYLVLYNAAAALGWAYVDYVIFDHFVLKKEGADTLYRDVGYPLKVVQTMAILEVVHAMLRFVRSSVAITAIQGASCGFGEMMIVEGSAPSCSWGL